MEEEEGFWGEGGVNVVGEWDLGRGSLGRGFLGVGNGVEWRKESLENGFSAGTTIGSLICSDKAFLATGIERLAGPEGRQEGRRTKVRASSRRTATID